MQALGVVLLKSVGAGYLALNTAGQLKDLEVLEFSPLGQASQILVLGTEAKVKAFIVEMRTGDIDRSICLPEFDEKILRAYLSLDNAEVKSFVLVVEGHFVGDLFAVATNLRQAGLQIVDFRVFRSSGSPGFLVLTGEEAQLKKADLWIQEQQHLPVGQQLKTTLLSSLSEGFRQFSTVGG